MSYSCEIKDMPPQPSVAIRTRTSGAELKEVLGRCFGQIMGYLDMVGEYPAGPPYVAYFNMDMADLEIEVGFPVGKALPGWGEVVSSEFPAGKSATCFYVGPYDQLSGAYDQLAQFMKENSLEPAGTAYEIYLNDPANTTPAELMTLIMFPLKTVPVGL